MNRNKLVSKLVQAESLEVHSGQLINADEDLGGMINACLFGDCDELLSDVFDEGTEMVLAITFMPSQVEITVPKIGPSAIGIAYEEFDDESLAALGQLVSQED